MKFTSVNCLRLIESHFGRTTSQSLLCITTSRCTKRFLQHSLEEIDEFKQKDIIEEMMAKIVSLLSRFITCSN